MFEKLASVISSPSTDDIKKPWSSHSAKVVLSEVKEKPKKQEVVYFSSRSRHMKVKTKDTTPKESSSPSRLSTVASLASVQNKILPGRKDRFPSGSSTTVHGSVGNESAATGTTAVYRSERSA